MALIEIEDGLSHKTSHSLESVLKKILAFDLEVTKDGRNVRHIGAVFNGEAFEWKDGKDPQRALSDLAAFGSGARYLLGHNLFGHDLPFLKGLSPELMLMNLPVIDTLYLSPLAFPRNPYHRLVKDYKLVRSSASDPLEDVRLALEVFADQWESLARQGQECPLLPAFYAFCLQEGSFGGFNGHGLAAVLGSFSAEFIQEDHQALRVFGQLAEGSICRNSLKHTEGILSRREAAPVAAYALAWLRVAGANSVLPPWVRHQFPEVVPFLKSLRDVPCGGSGCVYCREVHDPGTQLKKYFGFGGFRAAPRAKDGESLQANIVTKGMQDRPLLAILPTGGGKSLCYQLPALVRHRRRGLLTVVISPLQALMKDQVDNLVKNTGTIFAAAIYGLLTPPERGEVIERVRLGDIAILYISPEQLRSRSVRQVLMQREIGCWVFDEAHCFSKWGHDFRPDYHYAARFIRELCQEQRLELPPIACFTATAKLDVIDEIKGYFASELHQDLELFAGGVERDNLHFDVLPVNATEKLEQTFSILQQHLSGGAPTCIIVYAARRKTTEEIRDYLVQKGLFAAAFHAGLEASEKRRIIEEFVAGEIPVICATNAFGMGIDKENIRLVLHYDLPGSIENYLQEAGRAGRDLKPANCILLYDYPNDAENQFGKGAASEIEKDEIQRILKCLRRRKRNKQNEIVITTQELLRDEEMAGVFEEGDRGIDTKVRTAVSWLERADFLERNQNLTQVFQGKPLVKSVDAAEPVLQRLNLTTAVQQLWRGILRVLINAPADKGLSADDIAESLFPDAQALQILERSSGLTAAQLVIHAMHDMAAAGLLDQGMLLSAFVQFKGHKNAPKLLQWVGELEERLIKLLQEEAPDADLDDWQDLDVSRLNQRLQQDGHKSDPVTLRNLIRGLTLDGKGLAGSHGSIDLQHVGRNRYQVRLRRSWGAIQEIASLRRSVADVILQVLKEKAKSTLAEGQKVASGELLIAFGANELEAAIKSDLLLHSRVQKPLAVIDRALMFLHENKIIAMQNGLAVFRQAMTIRLQPYERRQYTLGDFKPLAAHYKERRYQIHVIVEYANLALVKIARAIGLLLDYFAMPRGDFTKKYFAGRQEILDRATSMESYRQIVESLKNPIQIGVVGSSPRTSQLVLAGPGSGKTRVVVHRCAYLLRVERVPARRILVMCFNHNAAVALRKRLVELVGQDARGVTVATYHGAAMRLAGISLRELMEGRAGESFEFDRIIRDAVALLKGEKEIPGLDPDEMREHLLQGFSHILVDEYQDIDQDQYELVSAIAGRTLEDGDGRLAILAVGDDDQNIYAFRGANVEFIRRFQKDYKCGTVYLVENYRSSDHIIQAANQIITGNQDRMKREHPIRIDRLRKSEPAGGAWARRDPLAQGRVQRLLVENHFQQAHAVYAEMMRLKSLDPDLDWADVAVLGRTKASVDGVRAFLADKQIPVRVGLGSSLPLHRVREVHGFLLELRSIEKEIRRASELGAHLGRRAGEGGTEWAALLEEWHTTYLLETADAELPVACFIDWLYEAIAEQRREKAIGRGVVLNTLHGAKGLEFGHVFILDGDWRWPGEVKRQEEERRLLYVGMTRAKQTLCLMEMEKNGNPFLPELDGPWMLRRQMLSPVSGDGRWASRRYCLLNLAEIILGYAGRFPEGHEIHQRLAVLKAGDRLCLADVREGVELQTLDGFCVAKLSAKGKTQWSGRLKKIEEATIIGMVQWFADTSKEEFKGLLKVDAWEVPLVELAIGGAEIT